MTLTGCLYESVEVKMLTDITVDEKEQSAAERRPRAHALLLRRRGKGV